MNPSSTLPVFVAFIAFCMFAAQAASSVTPSGCDDHGKGLKSFSESEIRHYFSVYEGAKSRFKFGKVGTVKVVPSGDGRNFTLTCQCAGKGDFCHLMTFKELNSISPWELSYRSANMGNGTYKPVKSELMTCNKNGKYTILQEDMFVKDAAAYACYTFTETEKLPCDNVINDENPFDDAACEMFLSDVIRDAAKHNFEIDTDGETRKREVSTWHKKSCEYVRSTLRVTEYCCHTFSKHCKLYGF